MNKRDFEIITDFYAMHERRPLFGYGLQRSGMSAVYHSVVGGAAIFAYILIRCGIAVVYLTGSGKDIDA